MKVQASNLEKIKFDDKGLIPAIIQETGTGEVLMLAYMNEESLQKTLASGQTWFYSRSRQELWHKGVTSGHIQEIDSVHYDCDADTLLLRVKQTGHACHEGHHSCFHYQLALPARPELETAGMTARQDGLQASRPAPGGAQLGEMLDLVYRVIMDRQEKRPEGSYTTYLFAKGLDKMLKKVGEETAEVIIAAKNNSRDELSYEVADLLYHLLVLLVHQGVSLERIAAELRNRR